jgi:hypothetical protein
MRRKFLQALRTICPLLHQSLLSNPAEVILAAAGHQSTS